MKLTPAYVMSDWSDKKNNQRAHYVQSFSSGAIDATDQPKITINDNTLFIETKMRPAMLDPKVVFNSISLCKDDTVAPADRTPYHDENSPVYQGYSRAVDDMEAGRGFVPVEFSVPLPYDNMVLTPEKISGHKNINYLTRNPENNTFATKKALILVVDLMVEVKNTGKASKLSERSKSKIVESWAV